jgi:hypothetical protein
MRNDQQRVAPRHYLLQQPDGYVEELCAASAQELTIIYYLDGFRDFVAHYSG